MCISYDALACQVWLDPIAMSPAGGQPLCADHAQRLSAPRGWVVLDRRTSQSTLMTAAGPAPTQDARGRAAIPRRRLPRAWGQFDAPRLEFLAEDDGAVVEPDPTFDLPVVTEVVEPEVVEPDVVEPEVVEPEVVEPEPEVVEPEPEVVEAEPEPEPVEPAVAVEPEPAPAPVAKSAPVGRRRPKAEAGPLGKPKGRLLSRAFESSGPQRSAITESLDALDTGSDGTPPEAAEG